MKLAITDANIFIDLFEIATIDLLFEINHEIQTTDRVLIELFSEHQDQLLIYSQKEKLILHRLKEEDAIRIKERNYHKGLSEADQSVLYIAEKYNAMVLTGDDLVRKKCHINKIEIHGILWLFDQFVEKKLLPKSKATVLLNALLLTNPRLPANACNDRLNKWKI
jgi:predicted nucleic acid-binding protein